MKVAAWRGDYHRKLENCGEKSTISGVSSRPGTWVLTVGDVESTCGSGQPVFTLPDRVTVSAVVNFDTYQMGNGDIIRVALGTVWTLSSCTYESLRKFAF